MRLPLTATVFLAAALPGFALAQSVNPSGMTLPNFQASALLSANTAPLAPTRATLQIAPSRPTIADAPVAKIQTVADNSAGPQQKQ
jgi:hypothetical protein